MGCCSNVVWIVAAALVLSPFLARTPAVASDLRGKVAIVTGASRGLGRGIAVGLGESGCTVYVTGRTAAKGQANSGGVGGSSAPGSLEETCDAIERAGGRCIAVGVDSSNDAELQSLFERVETESGGVDILVNNAFSAVGWITNQAGKPFWEKGVEAWDKVNGVGLRSHFVASVYASKQMVRLRKKGIIINVSSFGGAQYIFDVAYGIGKAGMDRMAHDMAIELQSDGVTMVSLWPGLVKTENMESVDHSALKLKVGRGLSPGTPEGTSFEPLMSTGLAETPLFSGRAVSHLARDPDRAAMSGKVLLTAKLAETYGFKDERNVRSPPLTSFKGVISQIAGALGAEAVQVPEPPPLGQRAAPLSSLSEIWWNLLPNYNFPGFLLKLMTPTPNV
eukprot:TRINITY_DN9346_c0_g1_i1.p1 TRINITY_DN9346_c0_g1~~TRINITY_DN9346_c0_g1_i1.p1  ORF type:complete len:392 (+),score=54.62 TRINITY_DN9346_c0_g1_i1:71-1246(+)